MAISAALAKQIAEAKTSNRGNRIMDGNYQLMVKQIICEQKFTGLMFIPEFVVIDAEKTHEKIDPNKPGTECSCTWAVDGAGKSGEAAKGNIKKFLCALLDIGPDDDFVSKLNEYSGPSGSPEALRAYGMVVYASTQRQKIQTGVNAGQEGVFPQFTHLDQTDVEVAARRKQYEEKRKAAQ